MTEDSSSIKESSSVESDSLKSIDEIERLVRNLLTDNLPSKSDLEKVKSSDLIDKLSKLSLNHTQKKIGYVMLQLGATYPSELHRLFETPTQLFVDSLNNLVKSGIVNELIDSEIVMIKKNYLIRELHTTPSERVHSIKFFGPTSIGIQLFQLLANELCSDPTIAVARVNQEVKKFRIVLAQLKKDNELQVQTEVEKNKTLELKESLSIQIDKLIIECKEDPPMLLVKIKELISQYPTQKGFLLKQLSTFEEAIAGKRPGLSFQTLVEQTERNTVSIKQV